MVTPLDECLAFLGHIVVTVVDLPISASPGSLWSLTLAMTKGVMPRSSAILVATVRRMSRIWKSTPERSRIRSKLFCGLWRQRSSSSWCRRGLPPGKTNRLCPENVSGF
jgi:hypothetical protein